jgi:general secretion pathway protein L
MTNSLILYFEPSLPEESVYLWFGKNEADSKTDWQIVSIESLSDEITKSSPGQTTVIIPGEWIFSCQIGLPNAASLKALPYLVEESLASPIEDIHLVHSKPINKQVTTYAIDSQKLRKLLELLATQHIQPTAVYADFLLLAKNDQSVIFGDLEHRRLLVQPNGTGSCIKVSEFDAYANVLNIKDRIETPLTIKSLMANALTTKAINFLQGDFKPVYKSTDERWRTFAVASFAALIILTVGYWLTAGWYFQDRAEELHVQAEQQYRELFPDTKNVRNIRRQLEGYLKNQGGFQSNESGFIALLSQASAQLTGEQNKIQHIRYDKTNNTLQLELQSANIQSVNKLQSDLQASGLNAEVKSASSNDAGVLARLTISAG